LIRFTELLHGKGVVSEVIKHRTQPPHLQPSKFLAFTETRRPLVFWNMTNECNLSCSHCYLSAGPSARRQGELSLDEAKAFIDDLSQIPVPLLMFSGGEPLVREDFWEIASYARRRGLKTALSTNGTLITEKAAERIKSLGIEYVGISLDGASEKTHDAMRGQPGSFQKAVQALRNCIRVGLKCGVRVTVTQFNFHELPSLIDLSARLEVPRFCLYWLVPSGRGKVNFTRRELERSQTAWVLDVLYRKAKELGPSRMEILSVDAPQDAVYLLNRMREENSPEYEGAVRLLQFMGDACSAGDRVANVDAVGDVYPCQFAQLRELRIGNVKEKSFSQLWNESDSPVLSAFRSKTKNLKGKCGLCPYKELCGGGCRVRAYVKYGDLQAEDPSCLYDGVH